LCLQRKVACQPERQPRGQDETVAFWQTQRAGANVFVVRLPQVHDCEKHGLVTNLLQIAAQTGVSAYLGDGTNRWCGAHVLDVARLWRLDVEGGETGACWHAVAEGSIPFIGMAKAVAVRTGCGTRSPDQAAAQSHFGPLFQLVGTDAWSDSTLTRGQLGWVPTGPSLFSDLPPVWCAATIHAPLRILARLPAFSALLSTNALTRMKCRIGEKP
jgi:hypothetical protein